MYCKGRFPAVIRYALLGLVGAVGVHPVHGQGLTGGAIPPGKSRQLAPSDQAEPSARGWETIPVPGARCGDGQDYAIAFSPGPGTPAGEPNHRLVIWLPGGGSTQISRQGELKTAIKRLPLVRQRRSLPSFEWMNDPDSGRRRQAEFIFTDHPDNAPFVRDAHWAIFPYTTQDFHSGRRTEPTRYDFTGTGVARQLEREINRRGVGIARARAALPGLQITGKTVDGRVVIDGLEIAILHCGAINVERSLEVLFERLRKEGFDPRRADILLSGSSAGGFGTWYNAWRIGDILYPHPGARFTVVPQAGSPTTMTWNEDQRDLVVDPVQVADLKHRLEWYDVLPPTAVPGADYRGGDDGLDVLDLLDHYLRRWPGMDVQFLPVVNREDFLAVRALDEHSPGFEARLDAFRKTVHRYAQYIHLTDRSQPYLAWLFLKSNGAPRRVHGFKGAALTVPMLSPDGRGEGGKSLLAYINMVATRNIVGPPQIEHAAGTVTAPGDLASPVVPGRDRLGEGDVPWPEKSRP